MTYRFTPTARAELADAIDWYADEGGADLAADFEAAVHRSLRLLADQPELGTPATAGTRVWPMRRFPYTLVYAPDARGLRVVAVAHQRRRPERWIGRR